MREFGITYQKGLIKGLRPFTRHPPNDPGLIECFNLMPHEDGLLPHEELENFSERNGGFDFLVASYFGLKDQNGVLWYWYVGRGLDLLVSSDVPNFDLSGFDAIDASLSTIPYWIQVDAFNAITTQMYLYPDINNGFPLVSNTAPAVGSGYDAIGGYVFNALSGLETTLNALTSFDFYLTD